MHPARQEFMEGSARSPVNCLPGLRVGVGVSHDVAFFGQGVAVFKCQASELPSILAEP